MKLVDSGIYVEEWRPIPDDPIAGEFLMMLRDTERKIVSVFRLPCEYAQEPRALEHLRADMAAKLGEAWKDTLYADTLPLAVRR
jgi:hypothetical protein